MLESNRSCLPIMSRSQLCKPDLCLGLDISLQLCPFGKDILLPWNFHVCVDQASSTCFAKGIRVTCQRSRPEPLEIWHQPLFRCYHLAPAPCTLDSLREIHPSPAWRFTSLAFGAFSLIQTSIFHELWIDSKQRIGTLLLQQNGEKTLVNYGKAAQGSQILVKWHHSTLVQQCIVPLGSSAANSWSLARALRKYSLARTVSPMPKRQRIVKCHELTRRLMLCQETVLSHLRIRSSLVQPIGPASHLFGGFLEKNKFQKQRVWDWVKFKNSIQTWIKHGWNMCNHKNT